MYDTLKFLHVTAAIVWIGSGIGFVALFATMAAAGDRGTLLTVGRHVERLGNRLFAPAAMSTLLFGILTVLASDGQISFADPWISIGFAGVALSLVIVALSASVTKRLAPAVQEHGPDSAQVAGLLGRARTLNYVDIVLLLIVVWAMVAKPGG